MSLTTTTRVFGSVLVLSFVYSQDLYEEFHIANNKLFDFPKKIEIHGPHVKESFSKYVDLMQRVARSENASVIYKIKVDISRPHAKTRFGSYLKKDIKTKKYNVPLKKNSMKLSNFETFLRKLAAASHNHEKHDVRRIFMTSTERINPDNLVQVKQLVMKYKPVKSKLSSFTKIIKPVRNRIITLKV